MRNFNGFRYFEEVEKLKYLSFCVNIDYETAV